MPVLFNTLYKTSVHQVEGMQRKRDSKNGGVETYCLKIEGNRFVLPGTEKSEERSENDFQT